MKEIEISGANRFETFTKTRAGSRAVILRDGMILLSHETVTGWWLVHGGGMENGETSEMCCVREVEEETGYVTSSIIALLSSLKRMPRIRHMWQMRHRLYILLCLHARSRKQFRYPF